MRAAVIEKPYVVEFKDVAPPVITRNDEVLIKVAVTGICGSEIHAYHGTHPFRIPPVISGHEMTGVVVETGKEVQSVAIGDRVTVEPQYGCGLCRYCKVGDYHLCPRKKVLGTQEWTGSFGEYIVVPEHTVIRLPEGVSFEQGALIEPLAVGVHAVRQAKVGLGDKVAVLGAGPIGLALMLAAKASGATRTFITDVSDYNLEIAAKLGSTYTINPLKENPVEFIRNSTNGDGVDVAFLAIGLEPVLNDALKVVKKGGKVSEVALFGSHPKVEISFVQNREISVIGSNMYTRSDFEIAAEAIAAGIFDTGLLISKILPIHQAREAMELVDKKTENVIKVLLTYA
jgi:2-desacetyl-2-hydroxyethyl bacteriochlorophyllide A dehydrogenase